MRILVTGAAGFIGSHLAKKYKSFNHVVLGVDNFTDYYSIELKRIRESDLTAKGIEFINCDLTNFEELSTVFKEFKPQIVVNLAAQAGIRLPIEEFSRYIDSNIRGFSNILIASSLNNVEKFLYASSSSVYGNYNTKTLKENYTDIHPVSFYGATKLTNEILANGISNYVNMKMRGLRFFTVYGPAGRPDMAYFKLINAAINEKEFHLNGDGGLKRDFTFIDDIIYAIIKLEKQLNYEKFGFHDVVNIGGGHPHSISELIKVVEQISKRKVSIVQESGIPQDVNFTNADTNYLQKLIGSSPRTSLKEGISKTYQWATSVEVIGKIEDWVK